MPAVFFLLGAVADFFATLFLLRFLMQAMRVSFGGQLGDFVVRLTNWAVKPLRKIIPGVLGLDWASLVAALCVAHLFAILSASFNSVPLPGAEMIGKHSHIFSPFFLLLTVLWLLRLVVYIFIGALILQAVLSWVNPYSPLSAPVHQLTRPILNPIRSILPPISGIDLSPLVAILLLQALLMVL